MRSYLFVLWLCTVWLAIGDGSPIGEESAIGDVAASSAGLTTHEEDLRDSTVLADVGVGKDACTGAYKKFKAGMKKMETLKKKAETKTKKAEAAKKKADGLLKSCKGNAKEVLKKANWKKAKIQRQIKDKSKKKIDAFKKKAKAKAKAAKKKIDAKMKAAKKKATSSTKNFKSCKTKAKKTKSSLKRKCKAKIKKFKASFKARMKKKLKLDVADGMARATKKVTKKQKKIFEGKLKKVQEKSTAEVAKATKEKMLGMAACKEDAKIKIAKAAKETPPPVVKEMQKLKSGLKAKTAAHQASQAKLRKTTAKLKDTKADLGGKWTKQRLKANDCIKREKSLNKKLAKKITKIKTDAVKMEDKDREIQRLKDKIKVMTTKLAGAQALIKSKTRKKKITDGKLKFKSTKLVEASQELKSLKTKMSAGEGALMGEIQRNKKTINREKDRGDVLGNKLAKGKLSHKKTIRKLNRCTLKKRELGQALYNSKRDVAKWTTKFETLTMAHTTVTQRLRDTRSKYELCGDRIREAKIKANGCQEAMNRLKTYTNDQINEQKMQLTRIRQKLNQSQLKIHSTEVSQAEKAKADKMAERAATKAASKAVAKANAKALAVKADARTAVAQAVKEAVKLTSAKKSKSLDDVAEAIDDEY
jgi:hypothetical protein